MTKRPINPFLAFYKQPDMVINPFIFSSGAGYYAAVMADSPVAYWRLGESSGTTATDELGTYNGTYVGSPTLGVTGVDAPNTAVQFGTSKLVTFSPSGLPSGNASRTLELWLKLSDATPLQVIFGYGDGATNKNFGLLIATTFQLWFFNREVETSIGITTNTWTHIVMTWDGSVCRFYKNGSEAFNSGSISALATDPITGFMASFNYTGGPLFPINGAMDEVAIYPTVLSAARILAHYNAATP